MARTVILFALPLFYVLQAASAQCDESDLHCRFQQVQRAAQRRQAGGGGGQFAASDAAEATAAAADRSKCDYPEFWLITGSADITCTRPQVANRYMKVDTRSITVTPEVIKLPGCFKVEFIFEVTQEMSRLPASFFGYVNYQWWNFDQFSNLKCQNASANGCGGFGNNCYYCDICNGLRQLPDAVRDSKLNEHQRETVNQFTNINCPNDVGVYQFSKEFCFNDYKALDADGDCRIDLGDLAKNKSWNANYKELFSSLQQAGQGTIYAKYELAHNASGEQLLKKKAEEALMRQKVERELAAARPAWASNDRDWRDYVNWAAQSRINAWHAGPYLEWLVYENQLACIKFSFDVCDREPALRQRGRRPPNPFGFANFNRAQPKYKCPVA